MPDPVVSVIIPTYRRWSLLAEALESLRRQTLKDWQAVVVNDAGPEPEGSVIELLRDPRVTYVRHKENLGLPSARNSGIACSRGKYLAYLDDDDLFYPDHLRVLVNELQEKGDDVVFSNAVKGIYQICNNESRLVSKIEKTIRYSEFRMWRSNVIPVLSVVHSKHCLEKSGLFDESLPLMEDWDLWIRMSCFFPFRHVDTFTAEYRVRMDHSNMSNSCAQDDWLSTQCRLFAKYLKWAPVISDSRRYNLLRSGLSHLVRHHFSWVADRFINNTENPVWQQLLLATTKTAWLRIAIRKPVTALSTYQLLNKCMEDLTGDKAIRDSF